MKKILLTLLAIMFATTASATEITFQDGDGKGAYSATSDGLFYLNTTVGSDHTQVRAGAGNSVYYRSVIGFLDFILSKINF